MDTGLYGLSRPVWECSILAQGSGLGVCGFGLHAPGLHNFLGFRALGIGFWGLFKA